MTSKTIMIIPICVIKLGNKEPEVRVLGKIDQKQHKDDYSLVNSTWSLGLTYECVEDVAAEILRNLKFKVEPVFKHGNGILKSDQFERAGHVEIEDYSSYVARLDWKEFKTPTLEIFNAGTLQDQGKDIEVYLIRGTGGLQLRKAEQYILAEFISDLPTATRDNNKPLIQLIENTIEKNPEFFEYEKD